jgi:hypothetical protein
MGVVNDSSLQLIPQTPTPSSQLFFIGTTIHEIFIAGQKEKIETFTFSCLTKAWNFGSMPFAYY